MRELIGDALEAELEQAVPEVDLVLLRSTDQAAPREVARRRADVAIVAGDPGSTERHGALCSRVLGRLLVALLVDEHNPVRSITTEQARALLTGAVTHWRRISYGRGVIRLLLPPAGPLADLDEKLTIPGARFYRLADRSAPSGVDWRRWLAGLVRSSSRD